MLWLIRDSRYYEKKRVGILKYGKLLLNCLITKKAPQGYVLELVLKYEKL